MQNSFVAKELFLDPESVQVEVAELVTTQASMTHSLVKSLLEPVLH